MQTNATKAKLKSGGTVFGSFVRTPDPSLIEFLGYQGWDFLILDAEHGTLDPNRCEDLVRAAELRGVTPLVRVTTNQPQIILRFLDTGAQGRSCALGQHQRRGRASTPIHQISSAWHSRAGRCARHDLRPDYEIS